MSLRNYILHVVLAFIWKNSKKDRDKGKSSCSGLWWGVFHMSKWSRSCSLAIFSRLTSAAFAQFLSLINDCSRLSVPNSILSSIADLSHASASDFLHFCKIYWPSPQSLVLENLDSSPRTQFRSLKIFLCVLAVRTMDILRRETSYRRNSRVFPTLCGGGQ